jgi:hypothetical protein
MSDTKFDLNAVIADSKKLILSPKQFYKEMPKTGGYAEPIIHLIVNAVVSGFILTIWSIFSKFANPMGFAAIIAMPIIMVIGSFIAAGILYVIWRLMGSTESYQTAYRCVAYTSSIGPVISLLAIIPYISTIIKNVWVFLLMYLASIEVHQVKENTAKIVFGILAVLAVVTGLGAERGQRSLASKLDQLGLNESTLEGEFNEQTAEQMGKNVSAFLKGLEEYQKEVEKEAAKQN